VALSSVVLTTTSFANPIIEKLSSVAYEQGENGNNSLNAYGHVAQGDHGLLNVEGPTTGMKNMMNKRINYPSSST
jgi:hypothetical protein